MFTTLAKIAALSAILSAGLVTAYDHAAAQKSDKLYSERVSESVPEARIILAAATPARGEVASKAEPATSASASAGAMAKGNRLSAASDSCAGQTWPYIDRGCLAAAEGTPTRKAARVVTIERRDTPNTSTLVRVGEVTVAAR